MPADGGLRVGRWVIGAGALLAATLLAGRLTGLLREIELAAAFGVSAPADAAVLLLTLPDLLVNLLLSGGLSAALVPRLRALAPHAAQVLLRQAMQGVVLVFGLLALLLAVLPQAWFALLAPGLSAQAVPPTAAILATALAVPLTAASGVTTAGLNALQRFFVAGCGTLIFNLVVIAALFAGRQGAAPLLVALGIGIGAGAALRLATQMFSLPSGTLLGPTWTAPPDRAFVRGFVAAAASASLMLLVPVIVRALASTTGPGAIAALNYAFKLVELPSGVLIASVATVALARLSEHHGRGDAAAARAALHDAVRRSLVNAVGAALAMAWFADAIVALALGRGAMGIDALQRVVDLTRISMIGLPFLALSSLAVAELNARECPQIVLKATLGCLLLLPLLALPGIVVDSERLLAAAVVGFQAVHALWLARLSGLARAEGLGWLDARMAGCLALAIALVAAAVLLDLWLAPNSNSLFRIVLAALAIFSVIVWPQRLLLPRRRANPAP